MTRAVVFAYHTIGVRCLEVLLEHGIEIALVVTHRDNPQENIWFDSVAALAQARGLPCIMPEDPNDPAVVAKVRALRPDFLFSFYYRHMLGAELLALPARGAYNLHGSLLPRYRGRVPVNWAVIHGETETGATLHAMTVKPDQGDIVAQERVPIGPDDTAFHVFQRVTEAGVKALRAALEPLVAGTAAHRRQNLAAGSYFGGRRPQDGRIDWGQPAAAIHNLVRGVAPPYPGAFTSIDGRTARILRTSLQPHPDAVAQTTGGDGAPLYILSLELEGKPVSASEFKQRYPAGVRPA
ncbi:MAG: formyltransferase [Betaproteobacteria bacterium]|nr:formyltransferase [Betaproteobacteria bacterium]